MAVDLGRVGIWSRELRYNPDPGARGAAAAELENFGYPAIFIPDAGGDVWMNDQQAHEQRACVCCSYP